MEIKSVLTFNDKLALFQLAMIAENEGSLTFDGILALEKIYNSCGVHEQEDLKDAAYMICEEIETKQYHEELSKHLEDGTAFVD